MNARFAAKWKLVQLLYQRGWDKQQVIDLFSVLDWMMRLPEQLKRSLWHNIEVLEEQEKMRYVTSVEQIGIEKGLLQGMQRGLMQGRAEAVWKASKAARRKHCRRLLQKRFGPLSEDVLARLQAASIDELELWLDRALMPTAWPGCLPSSAAQALWRRATKPSWRGGRSATVCGRDTPRQSAQASPAQFIRCHVTLTARLAQGGQVGWFSRYSASCKKSVRG